LTGCIVRCHTDWMSLDCTTPACTLCMLTDYRTLSYWLDEPRLHDSSLYIVHVDRLYRTLSYWLDEPRLHDSSLYVVC